jgi:hypothetical protein
MTGSDGRTEKVIMRSCMMFATDLILLQKLNQWGWGEWYVQHTGRSRDVRREGKKRYLGDLGVGGV